MPAYLSDEWLLAMDDALHRHAGLRAATTTTSLIIQNVVVGAPAGTVGYAISLDHGTNRVVAGVEADPDVTFTTDHATAMAINRGDESAQTAFMAGRLRIGGDARVLIANQGVLAALDDLFVNVRRDTEPSADA